MGRSRAGRDDRGCSMLFSDHGCIVELVEHMVMISEVLQAKQLPILLAFAHVYSESMSKYYFVRLGDILDSRTY